jgi:hypothetical protein
VAPRIEHTGKFFSGLGNQRSREKPSIPKEKRKCRFLAVHNLTPSLSVSFFRFLISIGNEFVKTVEASTPNSLI